MAVYWGLFAYFAVGASSSGASHGKRPGSLGLLYLLGLLLMVGLVGLRYEVGADWRAYEYMFESAARADFLEALGQGDPGYQGDNWIASQLGLGIWAVNLVCATIFTWGLARFCAIQPNPWLAAAVAIPYLVIVVAMGYSRQGVALGLLMGGIAAFLRGGSVVRFAGYVVVAALFHRTAVVAFPLVALSAQRNRFVNAGIAIATSILLYDLFLGDAMDDFVSRYIRTGYSSQGAAIRIGMNVVAAGAFWVMAGPLRFQPEERKLWRNFSLAAVGLLVLLLTLPSSTAVDRMSLYVLPLQIAVFARLPLALGATSGTAAAIAYAFLVQFVWLNFAAHARYWLPYQIFPLSV